MKTKAELEADLSKYTEVLFAMSAALDDDLDDLFDDLFEDEPEDDFDPVADSAAETLELIGINWLLITQAVCGDGSRGSYAQIPKSMDFFMVVLQALDRWFRHMFR